MVVNNMLPHLYNSTSFSLTVRNHIGLCIEYKIFTFAVGDRLFRHSVEKSLRDSNVKSFSKMVTWFGRGGQ